MTEHLTRDPLNTMRQTIEAIDSYPPPLSPQVQSLREILDSRLRELEAEQHRQTADLPGQTHTKA